MNDQNKTIRAQAARIKALENALQFTVDALAGLKLGIGLTTDIQANLHMRKLAERAEAEGKAALRGDLREIRK